MKNFQTKGKNSQFCYHFRGGLCNSIRANRPDISGKNAEKRTKGHFCGEIEG